MSQISGPPPSPTETPNPPAVALLPGMTLNATIFPEEVGGDTLEVEFSGLKLSATGALPGHPDGPMGPYVDRLATALAGWESWQTSSKRIAVGHSFGGMLLLAWLARQPDPPPSGVVLIATTAGPMYEAGSLRIASFGGFDLRLPVRSFLPAWNTRWVTRTMKRLTSGGRLDAVRQDFRTLGRPSDTAVDLLGWKNTDWRAMRSLRLAMVGFDVRHRLATITTPAVVLHGDRDSLISGRWGQELAAGLPHGRFELVRGAGHALPLTHGEAVLRAIRGLAG